MGGGGAACDWSGARDLLGNELPFLVAAQSLAKVVGFHLLGWANDVWKAVEKPSAEAHTEGFEWVRRRGKVADRCREERGMLTSELPLDSV